MSLRSILQKGRVYFDWKDESPEAHLKHRELWRYLTDLALSSQCILVNAQSVWNDLVPQEEERDEEVWKRAVNYPAIPRPKPPYQKMWLEALIDDGRQRLGAAVLRTEVRNLQATLEVANLGDSISEFIRQDDPATIVNATIVHDFEGSACFTGTILYWMNAAGNFLRSFRQFPLLRRDGKEDTQDHQKAMLKLIEGWVLHTFARLNCGNTALVPIAGQGRPHRGTHRLPSSVWHEIKVTSVPRIRKEPATVQGEHGEVRFHWVRGHYADYTKGAGLFGNPKLKAVFWIPEHRAGKEELGTVVSSYQLV